MDKMFENAKSYNEDDSQIYRDAVTLQVGVLCIYGCLYTLFVLYEC